MAGDALVCSSPALLPNREFPRDGGRRSRLQLPGIDDEQVEAKVMTNQRGKNNKDNHRRIKKKVSILTSEQIDYVDWKDASLLRRFVSDRSKIRSRRVTGNSTRQQKMCADAIKIAREMALLPYSTRVTTQRSSRGERDRGRQPNSMSRSSGSSRVDGADTSDVDFESSEATQADRRSAEAKR